MCVCRCFSAAWVCEGVCYGAGGRELKGKRGKMPVTDTWASAAFGLGSKRRLFGCVCVCRWMDVIIFVASNKFTKQSPSALKCSLLHNCTPKTLRHYVSSCSSH